MLIVANIAVAADANIVFAATLRIAVVAVEIVDDSSVSLLPSPAAVLDDWRRHLHWSRAHLVAVPPLEIPATDFHRVALAVGPIVVVIDLHSHCHRVR